MNKEGLNQQIKSQQKIFVSLIVLTLVSVGIAMSGIGGAVGITIALGIGFTQGLMVLGSLMHLKESSSMRALIGLTSFFVAYLVFATVLAYSNHIEGTNLLPYTPAVEHSQEHTE